MISDGPSLAQPVSEESAIVKVIGSSLIRLDSSGQQVGVDRSELSGIKYFAFYYSASWCPPCRAFTPNLVRFYNDFHPKHPNFEIILVGKDHSADDMISYMQDEHMPWMAFRYDKLQNDRLQELIQCGGQFIPALILIDDTGQVLSDTYVKGQYQGPERVLADIPNLVK